MPHSPVLVSRRDALRRMVVGAAGFAGGLALASRACASDMAARTATPARRELGVALVGLGRYSSRELGPALLKTRFCKLAGVVTGVPEKGAKWAQDFGFPESSVYSYETMHRLADNPGIDIVYVVTPNGLHAQHAIEAARAGKHVICEKPMANTTAECDAILDACRQAGVKCSVGYRLHFDPHHQDFMRLAADPAFGPFTTMHGDRGFVMRAKQWRADKTLAGGGPLMDLGVYIIQAACMANAEAAPIAVTAHESPKTNPELFPDVEQGIAWTMEFANGAKCEAYTSYAHSSDRFRAEGPNGWFEFKERAFTYRGVVCETSRGPVAYPPFNQQAAQMDGFAEAILTGTESIVPGEMGRRDLRIIEAIYEASRTGGRVTV